MIIGPSRFPAVQFVLCNALGAIVWATLIASLGWLSGRTVAVLLGDIRWFELRALGLVALAVLVWLVPTHFARDDRSGRRGTVICRSRLSGPWIAVVGRVARGVAAWGGGAPSPAAGATQCQLAP